MQNKYMFHSGLSRLCAVMSAIVLLTPLAGTVVYAQTPENEPAQVPLFVQGTMASPNIMLSFDNSGSMGAMVVPDNLASAIWASSTTSFYNATLHPDDGGLNGGAVNQNSRYVLSMRAGDIGAATGRSPQINPIYYNPTTRYLPWKMADGSSMPDHNPRFAPVYATNNGVPVPRINSAGSSPVDTVDLTLNNVNRNFRNCGTLNSSCPQGSFPVTPAVYFIYNGPNANDPGFGFTTDTSKPYYNAIRNVNNYTRIEISQPGQTSFNISQIYQTAGYNVSDPSAANYIKIDRSDCDSTSGQVICSQAAELQNFANWYVYYRGRTRTAIAALTQVFVKDYGMEFRFGWGDYSNYTQQQVRAFINTHPSAFYTWLYGQERRANQGTPTRNALASIGNYYRNTNNSGPWGAVPGTNDTTPQLACRRSYAIVITDGGWNDNAPGSIGNVDGTAGPVINGPGGRTYQYVPERPYMDNNSDTLADVAMYFWNRDLNPNLANEVPGNPAFWQNMVTHTVGFGVVGTLDPDTDLARLESGEINWPTAGGSASDPRRIDDLWHAAVNGHGSFSSASNTERLVESLSAIMESLAAADVTAPHWITATAYLEDGNRAYVPSYVTANWTGDLTAYALTTSGKVADGTILWTASSKMPPHAQRNIWIGTDSGPVEFNWSNVSADPDLKVALNDSENLVNFLRGDNTLANGAMFRSRGSNILGDIVNSNPILVDSGPNLGYGRLPASVLGHDVYNRYLTNKDNRTAIVFVGGNDGMLHAFDADTGVEVFAYIPGALAERLPQLASTLYDKNHYYYVDGPLTITDASIGAGCTLGTDYSCWRNVLLGSAGAGGKTVFALDVTNPVTYSRLDIGNPSVSNIQKTVLWELSPESDNGKFADLGYVMQPLQTGYMLTANPAAGTNVGQNQRWVAVFGNGAHSTNGQAVLYIVDLATGSLLKSIAVGSAGDNGLMGVTLIRDSNQVITGAYAGDLKGNLWRFSFDLDGEGSPNWHSTYTNTEGAPKPLFTTDGNRPIFHAPAYTPDPKGGYMVLFGTGKYYDTTDISDTTTEALYGIWDNNSSTVSYSQLLTRTLKVAASGNYYDLTDRNATVNWNTQRGWTTRLTIKTGQRSLFTPVISGSNAIFTTPFTELTQDLAESCEVKGIESGVIVANLYSGGLPSVTWDTNNDGVIDGSDTPYIGFPTNSSGPGSILHTPGFVGGPPTGSGLASCANGALVTINDEAACIDVVDNTAWTQLF